METLALFADPEPPQELSAFTIAPISAEFALSLAVERHYLHRRCPCSFAFGLFANGYLYGFIIYGTPSSAPLRRGLAGDDHAENVIELTRLWVDDRVPRNGESFLIGNTVRRVDKEWVVSFAEKERGHVGTVYQATNWIYTGLSAKRTDWTVEGEDKHGQTWGDTYTADEIREVYGDRFSLEDRPRKHRYVFLNAPPRRRRLLMRELRYPVLPYPKAS